MDFPQELWLQVQRCLLTHQQARLRQSPWGTQIAKVNGAVRHFASSSVQLVRVMQQRQPNFNHIPVSALKQFCREHQLPHTGTRASSSAGCRTTQV
jgi:hypothetical protein